LPMQGVMIALAYWFTRGADFAAKSPVLEAR
jgi:hypothetical protein